MIVEQRRYTLLPGQAPKFLALYEAEALAPMLSHYGRLVGFYRSEIGALNQITQLWAFADFNELRDARERLAQDAGFMAYVARMTALLQHQETEILTPAPFFQPLGRDAAPNGD